MGWCGHDAVTMHHHHGPMNHLEELAPQQYSANSDDLLLVGKRTAAATLQWQNLRIAFDANSILNDVDERTCYQEGDSFKRGNPPNPSTLCNVNREFDCWGLCTPELVVSSHKEQVVVNSVLPSAIAEISDRLEVNAVASNLIFDNVTLSCGAEGGVEIPGWMRTTGVPNADIVILVTMRPTMGNILAWGVSCIVDQNGRPIMGQINISPPAIDSISFATQVSITVHELIHVLGFSSSKYSSYIGWNDPPKYMKTKYQSHNGEQKTINRIDSPNVLKVAKAHFACTQLEGAELEEWGSQTTAGSHWEQRLFLNEIMTGSTLTNPGDGAVFSDLTLALLEDSGWYRAAKIDFGNYTPVEMPIWGKGLGCDFAQFRCELGWPQFETTNVDGYFCSKEFEYHCSFDLTSKGFCAISAYSTSLTGYYQHFEEDGFTGGRNPLADYCPYVEEYSNGDCRLIKNGPDGQPVDETSGEKWGNSSRCFRSSFVSLSSEPLNRKMHGKCYEYACGNDTLFIAVGKKWVQCDLEGGAAAVTSNGAEVMCPKYGAVCAPGQVTPNFGNVEFTDDENPDVLGPIIEFLWELFKTIHWVIWVVLLGIVILIVAIILVIILIMLRQKQAARKWKTTRTVNFREREMRERA